MQTMAMNQRLARSLLKNIGAPIRQYTPPMDMRQRVLALHQLPPMPETARRVLSIAADPNAGARELATVVELDPSLATQVIRWASSPFYGYRGRVASIQDAISRVLGYSLVMNLALGLATIRPLRVPADGPIGLSAYWRNAVFSASLAEQIAHRMPAERRPDRGMAYLAGLLHDLGFLLLGHLFPPEFNHLNRLIASNPEMPVVRLERFALAIDHGLLGAWLMEAWQMPEELRAVVAEHHNPDYRGEHANCVLLTLLAERLLGRVDMGMGGAPEIPDSVLAFLGLSEQDSAEALDTVMGSSAELDALCRQMAA